MALTGKGLIDFAKNKIGTPYVYGMKGEVLTKDKFVQLQKLYGVNYVWNTDANKIGKVCCDCSGLLSWYTGKLLSSSGLKDNAIRVQPISTIENAPVGATVWKQGHVGIFIGYENGVPMYIAEDGSAVGCRKNKLSSAKFTHWLLQSFIAYDMTTANSYLPKVKPIIKYIGHVQSIGDTKTVKDGQTCGTTGQSKRLEAFAVTGLDNVPNIAVVGQAHCQNIGWQNEVVFNGKNFIGTKGKALRLEAIKLKLIGSSANKYKIEYRVHMQSIGWGNWASDGIMAGTVNQKRRIEAIEVKVVLR